MTTWSSAEDGAKAAETICPICKGTRFVHPLLSTGKPDYAQVVPCRCTQNTSPEDREARLLRYSNLGPLRRLTFATLNPRGRSEGPVSQEKFAQAYQKARAFAAEPEGWLVLIGPSGCGKTHLAAAIANAGIDDDRLVFYITAPDLLDHLKSTFAPASETPFDEFFDKVRNTALLILDDLGVQSSTPWAREKLDQLLNHRFNSQLPTVIVSIVPIAELEERTRTRLLTSGFCQVLQLGEASLALALYGWPPEFELQKKMTFENFERTQPNLSREQVDNLERAYNLALGFARSPEGWVVFQGRNGCGKTHLAAAVVNYRYQNKQPALFVVVPDFLDHLRSTFSPESKTTYDQVFESVRSAPLLVLDDFGQQSSTPWAQEKLFQVINHRYNALLPTVITTTLRTDEMDNAVLSRFLHPRVSTMFEILAPDFRTDATSQRRQPGGGRRGGRN